MGRKRKGPKSQGAKSYVCGKLHVVLFWLQTHCAGWRYVKVNGPKPSITPPWPEKQLYLTCCSKREPAAEGPWSLSVIESWEGLMTGCRILLGGSKEHLRKVQSVLRKCSI